MTSKLESIRQQLQDQDKPRLRSILDQFNHTDISTWTSTLSYQDLFALMTKESDPQRMYKLARLYIILVEEKHFD